MRLLQLLRRLWRTLVNDTWGRIGNVSALLGILGAVLGAVWWFMPSPPPPATQEDVRGERAKTSAEIAEIKRMLLEQLTASGKTRALELLEKGDHGVTDEAPAPTRTSRPLPSSISMRSSCCIRFGSGRVSDMLEPAAGEASGTADPVHTDGKASVIGMKAGAVVPVSASLANRRQRNRRLGLILWRRATAEMFTSGRDASATIDCFSSSLHCRRVSATTAYRREKLSLDIGTDIAPVGRNRRQQELYPNRTARRPTA